MTDDAHPRPIDRPIAGALASARSAATAAAALDALCAILDGDDELADRRLAPDHRAAVRGEIAEASRALAELGMSAAQRSAGAADAIAELHTACAWIDVLELADQALPDARAWVAPWLAVVEQRVSAALPAAVQRPLVAMIEAGHPLRHTCRTTADLLPELAARCEAAWTAWAEATCAHPVARDARRLRDRVRERGWRYPELVGHARELAERDGVPVALVLDWILGSEPQPFGPSDAREQRAGRTGYAHSDPETIAAALALLEVGADDTFYDLGAGLGLPCLIAALSGPAICRGIEFHAGYVARARDNARQLGLGNVEFFVGDAAAFDWSDGTRFYMFNPFPDRVLRVVAERLHRLATQRSIRIACFHNVLPDFSRIGGDGPITVYEAGPDRRPPV